MKLREAIMKRISDFRNQNNLSLEDMADECGISKETLGKVGQEKHNPTLDTLQHIAARMGITVSQLIKIEPEAVYQVVQDDTASGVRFPFGVQACSNGAVVSEIMDLFPDLEQGEAFVLICNSGLLSVEQLCDVAADWVQEKYS